MADIDMIPRSYREGRRVARVLRRFGVALLALVLVAALGAAVLQWRLAHGAPRLLQLRQAVQLAGADSGRLAALQARHDTLARSVMALARLRGAGQVEQLALALERALGSDVWLTAVRYGRSELLLPAPAAPAASALVGDIVVQAGTQEQHWRVQRRIDIAGAADGYPALTAFMRAFAAQRGISEVHLVDSSSAPDSAGVIGFNVTALVTVEAAQP